MDAAADQTARRVHGCRATGAIVTAADVEEASRVIQAAAGRMAARWPGAEREDLISEGWLVALRVMRCWDRDRAPLRFYLWSALSQELPRVLMNQRAVVYVPRGVRYRVIVERGAMPDDIVAHDARADELLEAACWHSRARDALKAIGPQPALTSQQRSRTARHRWKLRAAADRNLRNLAREIGIGGIEHGT